jgi:hypothetical protein
MSCLFFQGAHDVLDHRHAHRVPQCTHPVAFRHAFGIVVGKPLQSFHFDRQDSPQQSRFHTPVDERRVRDILVHAMQRTFRLWRLRVVVVVALPPCFLLFSRSAIHVRFRPIAQFVISRLYQRHQHVNEGRGREVFFQWWNGKIRPEVPFPALRGDMPCIQHDAPDPEERIDLCTVGGSHGSDVFAHESDGWVVLLHGPHDAHVIVHQPGFRTVQAKLGEGHGVFAQSHEGPVAPHPG